MQRALTIKILTILGLAVLMLIPLSMIKGKVFERDNFRFQAANSIAESWTGNQSILTPTLVIPYTEVVEHVTKVPIKSTLPQSGHEPVETITFEEKVTYSRFTRYVFVQPDQAEISGNIGTEVLRRGIYEVPVYESDLVFKGYFSKNKLEEAFRSAKELEDEPIDTPPFLALAVADTRGISNVPNLNWGGQNFDFEPGTNLSFKPRGIHAPLSDLDQSALTDTEFYMEMNVRGMENLSFVTSGDSVTLDLKSDWPHPEFSGAFLPGVREIGDAGFSASWQVTQYATNFGEKIAACAAKNCRALSDTEFGVNLIDPVDVYLQTERSLKYGILFIGLSFISFFLFETFRNLRIHTIQYGLVGLSIAIFYLLLISLSEQINFGLSYLIATTACVALIFSYLKVVLSGTANALIFTGSLGVLYAFLFVIIQAEDFAMLLGAILVFSILAILMIGTRRIDWYEVGAQMATRASIQKNRRA